MNFRQQLTNESLAPTAELDEMYMYPMAAILHVKMKKVIQGCDLTVANICAYQNLIN